MESNIVHKEVIEALHKEVEKLGFSNFTLDVSSGSAKGDNYMGVVAKVTVKGTNKNGEEEQLHWICKCAPQTEIYRQLLRIDLVYKTEVNMYKLFDRLDEFQEEKAVLHPFNSHPKFLMSYLEPYKESLVMNDVKALGYIMRDRKIPLDVHHVKLVMEEYGKFHALSFALRDQNPEEFKKIKEDTKESFFTGQLEMLDDMKKHQEVFNSRLRDSIKDCDDPEVAKSLELYTRDAIDVIMENLGTTSEYAVVGHGDSWVNNMLWKYGDSNKPNVPTNVCLLDWQLVRFGSPAYDLSYFIYACTDKEFRDQHYDQMIKLYYYSLCKHLAEMGSDPEKLFPYAALEQELRNHCVFGFHMATMVLHFMMSETDEIPDWGDSGSADEMMESLKFTSKNDDQFKLRVAGAVQHMHEKGYFDYLKQ